ncbi:MAG: hypothetical protein OEO83_07740 [Alphaproteobacteria bacterium]|nr:hypothetical protein [Alphaproteobacteria bacterium]
METIETTHAISQPVARTDDSRVSVATRLRRAWGAAAALGDWYSEHCRRIRAYQELTRLDSAALDRILDGLPPRLRRTRRDV